MSSGDYSGWAYSPYYSQSIQQQEARSTDHSRGPSHGIASANYPASYHPSTTSYNQQSTFISANEDSSSKSQQPYATSFNQPTLPYQARAVQQERTSDGNYQRYDNVPRSYADGSGVGSRAYTSSLGNGPSLSQPGRSQHFSRYHAEENRYHAPQTSRHEEQRAQHDHRADLRHSAVNAASTTPASQHVRQVQRHDTNSPAQFQAGNTGLMDQSAQMAWRQIQHARTGSSSRAPPSTSIGPSRNAGGERSVLKSPPSRPLSGNHVQAYKPNIGRSINDPQSLYPKTTNYVQTDDHQRLLAPAQVRMEGPQLVVGDEPTTVDPSQIFDETEYVRWKAATEEATRAKQGASSPAVFRSSQAQHAQTDSASRDQMESEMKPMIEMMREYQTSDPAMFSAVWEQFKKAQASPRQSSQTPRAAKATQPHPSNTQHEGSALHSQRLSNWDVSSRYVQQAGTVSAHPTTTDARPSDVDKPPKKGQERRGENLKRKSNSREPDLQPAESQSSAVMPTAFSIAISSAAASSINGHKPSSNANTGLVASASMATAASPAVGKTIWPQAKRALLARVAIQALMSDPANASGTLIQEDIIRLLDKNPTYDQLCESFFQRGFKFDKGKFARTLLTTMAGETSQEAPEVTQKRKRNSSPEGPQNKKTASSKPATKIAETPFLNLQEDDQTTRENVSKAKYPPQSEPSLAVAEGQIGSTGAKELAMTEARATSIEYANKSKEAMARKQNFNDLIDMRELDDSDDEKFHIGPMPAFEAAMEMNEESQSVRSNPPQRPGVQQARSRPSTGTQIDQPKALEASASGYVKYTRTPLALPLDKNKALRRSTYDPATIAKDFLIAKGEHPTERPLNAHLEVLSVHFKDISYKTDLSTFRWDLVDPGEPRDAHGLPLKKPDVNEEHVSSDEVEHPMVRDTVGDRKTPEEAKRSDDAPPPNLSNYQVTPNIRGQGYRIGRRPGRARMQAVTPRSQVPVSSEHSQRTKSGSPSQSRNGIGISVAGAGSDGLRTVAAPPTNQQPAPSSEPTTSLNHSDVKMPTFLEINPDVFKKPAHVHSQGYPEARPEADNGDSSSKDGTKQLQPGGTSRISPLVELELLPTSGQQPPTIKRRGRPPKDSSPFGATPASSSGDEPRRRGRPPGSKNSPLARKPGRPPRDRSVKVNTTIPEDGIGVIIGLLPESSIPATVSYVEPKPAVHPKPKRWISQPTYPTSTPDPDAFVSFKCQWIGCKANLHNLNTLQKHIFKVHEAKCYSEESAAYSCFWNPCGQIDAFKTVDDWQNHIQKTHVEELAKQLGDGPTTHPVEHDDSYLADALGNRITPLAQSSGTPDPLPLYAGKEPTRSYHRAHENVTPEARARAEAASLRFHALRAVEAHREGKEVNKTAEWKDYEYDSQSESSSEDEDDEIMGN